MVEACALFGQLQLPAVQEAGSAEDSPGAGRADGHDVLVEHHEGQPPVAIEGVLMMETDYGLLFPFLEPMIARDLPVVLIGFAVPFLPIVKLAFADARPTDETIKGDLGLFRPEGEEVDHGIASVRGDPTTFQIPP